MKPQVKFVTGSLCAVRLEPHPEAPHGAFFKPTNNRCKYPAAAHEKIAADLGFDLGIPVAPVLLCDSQRRFGAAQEECCVSLITHPKTPPWAQAFTETVIRSAAGQEMRAAAVKPLSAIAVFDLWIGNPDRDNADNMIFGEDPDVPERTGFCAVDHDLAFGGSGRSWRKGGWKITGPVSFPKALRPLLDKTVMLHTVSVIEAFPDERVRACVNRIPTSYLSTSEQNDIVNGLIGRKQSLSALVLQYFEEG